MPARCAPSCARCPRHEPTSSDAAGAGDAADTRKNRVDPRQGITMIDPDQCPAGQSATGKDHGKTGAANTMSYGDYLHLDRSEEHTSELQSLMRSAYACI